MRAISDLTLGMACSCALAACSTHVVAVRPIPPHEEANVNDIVHGRETNLTLERAPAPVDAKELRLAGNVAYFQRRDPASSAWLPETSVPIAAVQRIELRDHGRGARHGFGFGALTGVVAGIIVGVAVPWSCDNDCTGAFTLISAAVGAGAFGLLGAGIGGAIGAPTIVEFKDPPRR